MALAECIQLENYKDQLKMNPGGRVIPHSVIGREKARGE
jgi:hypothetical protein